MKKVQVGNFSFHKLKGFTKQISQISASSPINVENSTIETLPNNASAPFHLPSGSELYHPDNVHHKQVGGNQGSLYKDLDHLLTDVHIQNILNRYFDEKITPAQLELLFYRMNSCGCGYIAAVNVLMEQFLLHFSEDQFYQTFGFPPYILRTDPNTGKAFKDFNYEYLFLEFFLYYAKTECGFDTIEEVLGNTEEEKAFNEDHAGDAALDEKEFVMTGMKGSYCDVVGRVMQQFLAEKGFSLSCTSPPIEALPGTEARKIIEKKLQEAGMSVPDDNTTIFLTIEDINALVIQDILNNGKEVVISMNDFTLFSTEDLDGNGILDDIDQSDVGSHAMSVIGVTDDNKLIVSSWGKSYIIDLNVDTLSGLTIYDFGF